MTTPRLLPAALGSGFYRYWHVPHPHGLLDIRETRRADLSVIGPGALAFLAAGSWFTGRVGTTLLLNRHVTVPFETLPWGGRVLVVAGLLGIALAALWWLCTARVRGRVARGVAVGSVARIPDNPDGTSASLHAAVTQLGQALRDTPAEPTVADPAFEVLRTAASALDTDQPAKPEEHPRLRRRCLAMVHRLQGTDERGPAPTGDQAAA